MPSFRNVLASLKSGVIVLQASNEILYEQSHRNLNFTTRKYENSFDMDQDLMLAVSLPNLGIYLPKDAELEKLCSSEEMFILAFCYSPHFKF